MRRTAPYRAVSRQLFVPIAGCWYRKNSARTFGPVSDSTYFKAATVLTATLRSLLILLILAGPGLAHAQGKKGKTARPKVGDMVKVDWAGKEQVAEVIGYSGTGWITVKFNQNGHEMTPTLPPQQLRPMEK